MTTPTLTPIRAVHCYSARFGQFEDSQRVNPNPQREARMAPDGVYAFYYAGFEAIVAEDGTMLPQIAGCKSGIHRTTNFFIADRVEILDRPEVLRLPASQSLRVLAIMHDAPSQIIRVKQTGFIRAFYPGSDTMVLTD